MKNLRIGIIGAGLAWERLHWPAFQRLRDHFTVVAISDKDINKARTAANQANVEMSHAFDSYQKMLNNVEIDAVDILVPIDQTFEVTKDILAHNVHVIMEKPVAATLSGAKELNKLAKKRKVMVAENYRYDEENKIIKNLIDEKAIGNVVYFIDNFIQEFQVKMLSDDFASTEWRQHPDFKGGIFLDSAIHHMARHRFLFGDVVSVYAHGRESDTEFSPYSSINALLRFHNQVSGHYSFYCISRETQAPLVGLRIFGTNGEIYLEDKNCGFVNLTKKTGEHQAIPYKPNEGYFNELLNFHEAIINDTPIISTTEKGLGDMQSIISILKSIESGNVVDIAAPVKKKRSKSAAQ